MPYLWVGLYCLSCAAGWCLTLVGLPGNWLIVGVSALVAWLFPLQEGLGFGWKTVGLLAGFALLGEILEAVAGAAGLAKGGSRRGAIGGMIGSFAGAIIGTGFGPIVGTILLAAVGAMVGAIIGETTGGKSLESSVVIGKAAFVGRLLATAAKVTIASIMVAVGVYAVLL